MKPEKCHLLPLSVPFVGHILSAHPILSTDPEKASALKFWPPPSNLSELRVFLGKIGYYRKLIPDCATLATPPFQLEETSRKFDDCQNSYGALEQALCEAISYAAAKARNSLPDHLRSIKNIG